MFSYFYGSSEPEELKLKLPSDPADYPQLSEEFDPDVCFEKLLAAFEDRDDRDWQIQVDDDELKQWWCYVEDSPIIMMKARSVLKAPAAALINCA